MRPPRAIVGLESTEQVIGHGEPSYPVEDINLHICHGHKHKPLGIKD